MSCRPIDSSSDTFFKKDKFFGNIVKSQTCELSSLCSVFISHPASVINSVRPFSNLFLRFSDDGNLFFYIQRAHALVTLRAQHTSRHTPDRGFSYSIGRAVQPQHQLLLCVCHLRSFLLLLSAPSPLHNEKIAINILVPRGPRDTAN